MKAELKNMSRKELEKLKANVEKALARVSLQEMKAARIAAEKAAAAHGFSLAEITGNAPQKTSAAKKNGAGKKNGAAKKPSAPKYCNPSDNSQTWTGKGRQPEWFKSAVAAGVQPDSMTI